MSYFNDENDPNYDPEQDQSAIDSEDESLPFTLGSSKSKTHFCLPSTAEMSIQVFPPGHTFVDNLEYKDIASSLNMVEHLLFLNKAKPDFQSMVNDSIWSLFSLMAFDSLASNQSTTTTWEANLLLVSAMDGLIQNFDNMEYFQENLIFI
jgi:hypothetical protein